MEQNDIKVLTDAIGMLTKYNDFASKSLAAQIQRFLATRRTGNKFAPQQMKGAGILEGSNKPKDVIDKESRMTLMEAAQKRNEILSNEEEQPVRKTKKNDTTNNQ